MSESLNDILQKPTFVTNAGDIYPVLIKEYDKFMDKIDVITYSYEHFNMDVITEQFGLKEEEIKLLDLLVLMSRQSGNFEVWCDNLKYIFSVVLRKKVIVYEGVNGLTFFTEDHMSSIDRTNYDAVREVIMSQNLIFTPPVYKNKLHQEWAMKVLKVREKKSIKINMEAMLSTISCLTGKHYWELENYTVYQIRTDFDRICKLKNFDSTSILMANPYATDIQREHFAETIDIHKNPYDDIFVSSDKLGGLNEALGK